MLQFNVLFVWREKYEMGIIKNFCQRICICTHDSKCLYTICLPHDYSIVKIGHFWPRWYCFKGWSRKLRNCISVRSTITHKRVTSFHEIIKYFICGRCIKGDFEGTNIWLQCWCSIYRSSRKIYVIIDI